jgi:amidophosphoribosyltransferase
MCGLVAVLGGTDAPIHARAGLRALQHRGQDSAGLAFFRARELVRWVGSGLVDDAIASPASSAAPPGSPAIGHVRYATSFRSPTERGRGTVTTEAIQPLVGTLEGEPFVLAHNGQVRLRPQGEAALRRAGRPLAVATDSAWLVALIEEDQGDLLRRVARLGSLVEGSFSLVVATAGELVVSRDVLGIRPLFVGFGASGDRVVIASEPFAWPGADIHWEPSSRLVAPGQSSAFRLSPRADGAAQGREVEIRVAETDGPARELAPSLCLLETVYFAAPRTVLVAPESVERRRERLGEELAELEAAKRAAPCDLVVGVPDSGLAAARGFARRLGIPIGIGLRRHAGAQRSFLAPTPQQRTRIVNEKMSVDPDVVRGRDVVVVDDSVVRGTTSRAVAAMLREAGARSVHLRLASPRLAHPCQLGVDMPTRDELVAHRYPTDEALAAALGFASVGFLPLERTLAIAGRPGCAACFATPAATGDTGRIAVQ